jgi:hypothetical protein
MDESGSGEASAECGGDRGEERRGLYIVAGTVMMNRDCGEAEAKSDHTRLSEVEKGG